MICHLNVGSLDDPWLLTILPHLQHQEFLVQNMLIWSFTSFKVDSAGPCKFEQLAYNILLQK